ncbi:MAG: methyl-accepting chemotaxis protein, partial [Deltaproteobacteria bacterium]|nr:methyl-accepting chemotaxis protein [Deltaproteobacteria bacterium]
MSIVKNMKTRAKLLWAFMLIAVLMVISGGISLYRFMEMKSMIQTLYDDRLIPAVDLGEIGGHLSNIRIGALRIINEPDAGKRQEIQNNALNSEKEIEKLIEKYGATYLVPEEKKVFEEFKPAWKAYNDSRTNTYKWALEGKFEEAKHNAATDAGAKFKVADEKLKRLIEIQGEVGKELYKEADDDYRFMRNATMLGTSIGIIFAISMGIILSNMIARPLSQGVALAEAIADGDMTHKIDVTERDDEVGHLMISLDKMSNSLSEFLKQVSISSSKLASSSEQLSASSTQIAKGAEAQTQKAAQVATAAEQMSATVIEVAKNASGASEAAKDANKAAHK